LQQYLKENGIETLIHYPVPPHKQKAYEKMNNVSFPISEEIHKEVLSLPMNPNLDKKVISQVVNAINIF